MPLVALAALVLAVGVGAAPATAGAETVVNASFESSVAGWKGKRATLASVAGGVEGTRSARVALSSGVSAPATRTFSLYLRPRVPTVERGALYVTQAWVRGRNAGRTICLRVRELRDAALLGGARTCLTSTGAWQRFSALRYRAVASTSTLGLVVSQGADASRDAFVTDAVRVAVSRPPAPDPEGPPAGSWYSPESPFNQPIAADAAVDASSAQMVQTLVAGARSGFPISAKEWTTPVYYASASTPKRTVSLTAGWAPARSLAGVPIPANAQPDPAGDAHLTIMDEATGCEYDFWQARKNADGSWSASWGNATQTTGTGIYAGGLAATASGFANGLGKIRPEELAAGEIPHALFFAFPHTKAGGPVWPATSSDGRSTIGGAIPEGARLQLDPRLDLDSLGLNAWQKVVARTLQKYGMFLGDTGGTVALYAVNAQSFPGTPYPWGDAAYPYMPTSLLEHMRVLELPPQHAQQNRLVETPCAELG